MRVLRAFARFLRGRVHLARQQPSWAATVRSEGVRHPAARASAVGSARAGAAGDDGGRPPRPVAVRRVEQQPRGPGGCPRAGSGETAGTGDVGRRPVSRQRGGSAGRAARSVAAGLDCLRRGPRAERPPRRLGGHPGGGVRRRRCRSYGTRRARRTRQGADCRGRAGPTDRPGRPDRVAAAGRGLRHHRPGPDRRRDPRDADRGRHPARRPGPVRRLRDGEAADARSHRGHPRVAAHGVDVHCGAQPALRGGVVGVRGFRGVPLVALVPRRARAAADPAARRGK